MSIPHTAERGPRGMGTALNNSSDQAATNDTKSAPILPDAGDIVNGVLVLVVAHRVAGELRYRRRVFFNLPAAQRAADRATMRGHRAAVVLCKLAPVETVPGGWSA